MKLSKLLIGAVAGIAMVSLFSCAETAGETGKIGKDLSLTNDTTDDYKRGYTSLKTKHTSGAALVTLPKYTGDDPRGAGVIGFIFGIRDVEAKAADVTSTDPTYKDNYKDVKDFIVVGVKRNKANNLEAYVSAFANVCVNDSVINLVNNFTDLNGNAANTKGSKAREYEAVKAFKSIGEASSADGDVVLRIEVVAGGEDTDKDGKVEAGEGDGSYKIEIYNTDEDNITKKGDALLNAEIPASVTGDTKATQYDLGIYTNAYHEQTLTGKLYLTDLINEAGVVLE